MISVIMPVFNAEKYLRESVQSILSQKFSEFEFIIIDDCSTDNSTKLINDFLKIDKRIVFLQNVKNIGITKTLNKGISVSKFDYIARQDADDVSLPDRFRMQMEWFNKDKEKRVMCGTNINYINKKKIVFPFYCNDKKIKQNIKFTNCFIHSSVIFKKMHKGSINFYDERYKYAQDHNLWSRITSQGVVGNLNAKLLNYRINLNSISNKFKNDQAEFLILSSINYNFKKNYESFDDLYKSNFKHNPMFNILRYIYSSKISSEYHFSLKNFGIKEWIIILKNYKIFFIFFMKRIVQKLLNVYRFKN